MQKKKWIVDIYRGQICDDIRDDFEVFVTTMETYAISKAKAINNVRFRFAGLKSQYKPYDNGHFWEAYIRYEAREVETDAEENIDWQVKEEDKKIQQEELFTWRYHQ